MPYVNISRVVMPPLSRSIHVPYLRYVTSIEENNVST